MALCPLIKVPAEFILSRSINLNPTFEFCLLDGQGVGEEYTI